MDNKNLNTETPPVDRRQNPEPSYQSQPASYIQYPAFQSQYLSSLYYEAPLIPQLFHRALRHSLTSGIPHNYRTSDPSTFDPYQYHWAHGSQLRTGQELPSFLDRDQSTPEPIERHNIVTDSFGYGWVRATRAAEPEPWILDSGQNADPPPEISHNMEEVSGSSSILPDAPGLPILASGSVDAKVLAAAYQANDFGFAEFSLEIAQTALDVIMRKGADLQSYARRFLPDEQCWFNAGYSSAAQAYSLILKADEEILHGIASYVSVIDRCNRGPRNSLDQL